MIRTELIVIDLSLDCFFSGHVAGYHKFSRGYLPMVETIKVSAAAAKVLTRMAPKHEADAKGSVS